MKKAICNILIYIAIITCAPGLAFSDCDESPMSSWTYNTYEFDIAGIYSTQAAAMSARDARYDSDPDQYQKGSKSYLKDYSGYGVDDPGATQYGSYHVTEQIDGGGTQFDCYAYCRDGVCDPPSLCPGLMQQEPGEDCNEWVPLETVYDDQGNVLYMKVLWDCGIITEYGDPDALDDMLNGDYDGSVEYPDYGDGIDWDAWDNDLYDLPDLPEAGAGDSDESIDIEDGEYQTADAGGFDQGQDSTGNTTELEHLQDIVDNTAKIANNQKEIGDYLKDIDDQLRRGIDVNVEGQGAVYQSQSGEGGEGEYGGPSAEEIASAIDAENRDLLEDQTSDSNTDATTVMGDFEDYDFDDELGTNRTFSESDAPEENHPIEDLFDGFLADNPISDALDDSGVSLSDQFCQVAFDWNFGAQEHTTYLSMCDYEEELETWGTILVALVSVISILIVVRG